MVDKTARTNTKNKMSGNSNKKLQIAHSANKTALSRNFKNALIYCENVRRSSARAI